MEAKITRLEGENESKEKQRLEMENKFKVTFHSVMIAYVVIDDDCICRPMKLPSGECHKTLLKISQYWFR